MSSAVTVVWFRHDLRVADHPALDTACQADTTVLPVYLLPQKSGQPWVPSPRGTRWCLAALGDLDNALQARGSRLWVGEGDPTRFFEALCKKLPVKQVLFNRCYEPWQHETDQQVVSLLEKSGVVVQSFNGNLLNEPWEVTTQQGNPYQKFTPYWKACTVLPDVVDALPAPAHIPPCPKLNAVAGQWYPYKKPRREEHTEHDAGLRLWGLSEESAHQTLRSFVDDRLRQYPQQRDVPGVFGTARGSPYLHWGMLSPRQVWHTVAQTAEHDHSTVSAARVFLRQLIWREFAFHLLYHFPHTPTEPLKQAFARFPWDDNQQHLHAWQQGQTGYPIVDAGMRELLATGWMHNRVRMVVGSFLVKDLRLPWQLGARWFWEQLFDADLANNTLGWQWVAGCGADSAPYFRVFNPMLQGQKFDARGEYVRRWVSELNCLDTRWIHAPWEAPAEALAQAGVRLGKTYPSPIVNHQQARGEALEAYNQIKQR